MNKPTHIKLTDLPDAVGALARVAGIARQGVTLGERGNRAAAQAKLQEALVLTACAQAQIMLNLALLSLQAGDAETARSYCELAVDELETVGQEEQALGKLAAAVLACLPPAPDGDQPK